MISDWLFICERECRLGNPLALRVAFSPCNSLFNSPSFARGETSPLSNIDSEVGQEPRGWELGCSHRRESRAPRKQSRSRLSAGSGRECWRRMWYWRNSGVRLICDQTWIFVISWVGYNIQDQEISVGCDATAWKRFLSPLIKDCNEVWVHFLQNPEHELTGLQHVCVFSPGNRKTPWYVGHTEI